MSENRGRASVSTHTELAHAGHRCPACGRVVSSDGESGALGRCADCRGSN